MENGYEYITSQTKHDKFDNVITNMLERGWEVVSHSFDCEWRTYNIIFKRPKQTLNADIRNKLGPLQTLIDLVNTWGFKYPSEDDAVKQLFDETVKEAKKSMEYLKHIGE